MTALIPMSVNNITVRVGYWAPLTSFDIGNHISNATYPVTHSITQPPIGMGSLARDPNMWDRYQYSGKTIGTTGTFTVSLTVTDANNETDTAVVTFILDGLPVLPAPTIDGPNPAQPYIGHEYTGEYYASSLVTEPYVWALSGALPAGLSFSQVDKHGAITGIATAAGEFPITITASDSSDPVISKSISVRVIPVLPMTIQAPALPSVIYKKEYSFTFNVLNARYAFSAVCTGLPTGMICSGYHFGSNAITISGAPLYTGTFNIVLSINAPGTPDYDFVEFTWTVEDFPEDFSASDDFVTTAFNTPVTVNVLANDSSGAGSVIGVSNPAHGTIESNALDNTRVVYVPTTGYFGSDSFVYTVSDGVNTAQATVHVTVGSPGLTDGPVITAVPTDADLTVNEAYTFSCTATGGVTPYVWRLPTATIPSWFSINASTGVLTATPPLDADGQTFNFQIFVTDSSLEKLFHYASASFTVGSAAPAGTATIQGTLRLDTSEGPFAARKVYLYDYVTGNKVAQTTSNGTTGAWTFTQVAPGEYFVVGVAQDDDLSIPRDFDALGVITVI